MKKNEKRGIIISTTVTIMGLIGIVYTTIMKNNVEDTISMYSSGITLLTLGLILVLYYIKLSKNKKKSDEQENLYLDERINANREKSFAITFKIIIWISLIADYIVTFFFSQYQMYADVLYAFTFGVMFIYLIVYYFVSKKN